jgi:hypothetical protein
MQWYAVPCDWDRLMTAPIEESDEGQALGAWLLELDGPRALSVSIGGPQRQLKLGFPQAPFSPDSTLPTRAPGVLLDELHTAFGWELCPSSPPRGPLPYALALISRPSVHSVRLRDPVLEHFRSLQADLAERGGPLELRVDLTWDCCSAELAEEARLMMRAAMRRRRPRREVFGMLSVWMDAVRLQATLQVYAPSDPGRLVQARVVRALSRDTAAALTTADAPSPCLATPDLLFGLLSLCSLAEADDNEPAQDPEARERAAVLAQLPF